MNSFLWKRLVIWICLIPLTSSEPYFVDYPPERFYNRKSIDDCEEIFYSNWTQPPGTDAPAFGGSRANFGEFPHMAAIGWTSNGKTEYKCGGSLITPKFVLTAAHCATNANGSSPDTVRLGDTNLESTEDDEYAQQIKIRSFKRHPSHRLHKSYFDIALIELETEANIVNGVLPACLWLEKHLPAEEMTSIGFGATEFADSSPTLQKVTLSSIGLKQCDDRFSVSTRQFPNGIVDHQFCAGSSSMDTCQGDSGGPIQVLRADIEGSVFPLIVGIVSFGTICTSGSVGIYTRVADFREWIESETKTSMDYWACTSKSNGNYTVKTHITHKYLTPYEPFHRVGLLWDVSDQNIYQCGATVIDYQYVITSAFCVKKNQNLPKFIKIEHTAEIVEIDKIIIHPDYSTKFDMDDIALLKLSKYLKGDKHLLPACPKWKSNIREDSYLRFSAYTEKPSHTAYSSELKIDINTGEGGGECNFTKEWLSMVLCGNHNIAFVPTVCNLDYGGPVTFSVFISKGIFVPYLLGVVSNLSNGCGRYLFGTRLQAHHIEWIENIVLEHTNDRLIFL